MAPRKKTEALVNQDTQQIVDVPQPTQALSLSPEQVAQMTGQQTADLINLLQQKQTTQTTQLLTNLYIGLGQQNRAAAEALTTLLQVSQSQSNQGLQDVITQHYGSAIGGQQQATNQLITDIGEGEQGLRFLESLGLQQVVSELGVWKSEAPAGDALPPVLALSADQSEGKPDPQPAAAERCESLTEAGL